MKPVLEPKVRDILEDFGVMPAPKVPPLDHLVNEVRERGGAVALKIGVTGCSATVTLSGSGFDAMDSTPALAVAEAFAAALMAEPRQVDLFGGDGSMDDDTRERLRRVRERMANELKDDKDAKDKDDA